ncbi:MAG: ferrous iron transport protein A [Bacteroidia bacterium]|nr:ferrous iron transport protein A [Bacteroidia bacterium]
MTLADVKPGQHCTVVSFTDEFLKLKLMEMGCLPGEVVKVIRLAPPGDPMAVSVSNYVLAIRIYEAKTIVVEPLL